MEIDSSLTQANDELEFIELTGIHDDILDQEIVEEVQGLRNKAPGVVLMLLTQQLPTQLDCQIKRISKLEDQVYERLLGMLNEAIWSGK